MGHRGCGDASRSHDDEPGRRRHEGADQRGGGNPGIPERPAWCIARYHRVGVIRRHADGGRGCSPVRPVRCAVLHPRGAVYLARPGTYPSRAAAPLMDGMVNQLIAERSLRMIGANYYGTRHVTSGARALHTVDDMKGFKLRIPEVDTYRAMAEAWGARPTPLNIGELYLALSQGAVDGEENPLPTIQASKFNEVQKYLVLTAHIMTPRPIMINERTWAGLDAKQQEMLRAVIAKRAHEQDDEIVRREAGLAETFAKGGMTVITPDIESFRKPVIAKMPVLFEAKWGKGLWDKVLAA